ncbi:hypothetical protein Dsin_026649 [Dipteronia sinensis]|uniref:non-specific serine/threonine protein kinase n=1 Tax=Dipteronia sinensis TaxID=43782 RepID=A0AAD9ZYM3_9ROSI|nr:hypothetical protein Dsin_026649 [Dipteronia sinensis]
MVKATAENVDEAVQELPDANLVRFTEHALKGKLCRYWITLFFPHSMLPFSPSVLVLPSFNFLLVTFMVTGADHSSAIDWWALGILLYEILYGRTPFRELSFPMVETCARSLRRLGCYVNLERQNLRGESSSQAANQCVVKQRPCIPLRIKNCCQ